jgi:hypothetical protein
MDLSSEQQDELQDLMRSRDVPADVARRAQIVLWVAEGRRRKDVADQLNALADEWTRAYLGIDEALREWVSEITSEALSGNNRAKHLLQQ